MAEKISLDGLPILSSTGRVPVWRITDSDRWTPNRPTTLDLESGTAGFHVGIAPARISIADQYTDPDNIVRVGLSTNSRTLEIQGGNRATVSSDNGINFNIELTGLYGKMADFSLHLSASESLVTISLLRGSCLNIVYFPSSRNQVWRRKS